LAELLVVVALLGLSALLTTAAWQKYRRASSLTVTAQTFLRGVAQARLRAIYQNRNHFVVLNMNEGTLTIVEDSGANVGVYESDDRVITRTLLEPGVELAMPTSTLPHPLGSGTITKAWTMPSPQSGTQWGDAVGLMASPDGRLVSVNATPEVIGFGAAVFREEHADRTVSVGIEGRSGTVKAFRLDGSKWVAL